MLECFSHTVLSHLFFGFFEFLKLFEQNIINLLHVIIFKLNLHELNNFLDSEENTEFQELILFNLISENNKYGQKNTHLIASEKPR